MLTYRRDMATVQNRGFRKGQALIEFAVALPFIIFIGVAVINFGFYFYDFIGTHAAVREGARAAMWTGTNGDARFTEEELRTIIKTAHGPIRPLRDEEIRFSVTPGDPDFGGNLTSVTVTVDHRHELVLPIYFANGVQILQISSQLKVYRVPGFSS